MTRRRASVALACCLLVAGPAAAQAYVDRVLDEGPQETPAPEAQLRAATGWPRGWRVETSMSQDGGDLSGSTRGLAISGFVDTPNHGALSLNAALARGQHSSRSGLSRNARSLGLWRIDQVGLPLDGGWYADHSAGHVSSLNVPMARGFGRLGLPSSPVEGMTARYRHGDWGTGNVTVGRPGVYSGLGINGFSAASGLLTSAGLQYGGVGTGSGFALQYASASRLADLPGQRDVDRTRAVWGAWRWAGEAPWADQLGAGSAPVSQRDGGMELQVNALGSQTAWNQDAPAARGRNAAAIWADARWRSDWVEHTAGLFHLGPGLRWGPYNAASDLQGAYWRGDLATRQWLVSALLETGRQLSRSQGSGRFASLTARYRWDTRHTVLGGLAVRRGAGAGESLQLGWEHQWRWGLTQWRADVLRAAGRRATRVGMDHNLLLADGGTLAVGLGLERGEDEALRKNLATWGLIGGIRPWSAVSVDANLQGIHGNNRRQLTGSLGLAWQLGTNWSLLGQLSYSRGRDLQHLTIISPLTQAVEAATLANSFAARRLQLTLRYEERAGRATVPLGGTAGMGAGGIVGHVFFDGNENGRRDPGEAGVPDVVVRLDGRFVARTDAQGLYEFPAVAPGTHKVEVVPDNVPLPWSPQHGASVTEVRVRATSVNDFALRRDR